MIHFKPGSHAYNLINLLSVTGEFPLCSLEILGSRQTYENTIRRMLITQKIVDGQEDITCKLLTVSGLNGRRRIRLTKEALPILNWLGAEKYYYENYMRSHRSSNGEHTIRSARFAESVAMFMAAGYEFRPQILPMLQVEECKHIMGRAPVFYPAKLIKTFDNSDIKKTGFTRMTGALLAHMRAYIVYNSRNELMKGFDGGGEMKAYCTVGEIATLNAGCDHFHRVQAIIFGKSNDLAVTMLKTYEEQFDKYKRVRKRGMTYENVHFFTLDTTGVRQLRLMKDPDWEKHILDAIFGEEASYEWGNFDNDLYANGICWLSFLSGDICKLLRFYGGAKDIPQKCRILCFPHQIDLVRGYLGNRIRIVTITLDDAEEILFG